MGRLTRAPLLCRWRHRVMAVSLAFGLCSMTCDERCCDDNGYQGESFQQFLQIFPTVLSALLFS